jgi:hypothetical protein
LKMMEIKTLRIFLMKSKKKRRKRSQRKTDNLISNF